MLTIRRILTGGMTALLALTLVGARPVSAAAQRRNVYVGEVFLGIRLDKDSFSDVMRRYGPPKEIQAGGPRLTPAITPSADTPGATPGGPGSPPVPSGGPPLSGFPPGGPGGPPGGFGGGGFGGGSGSRGSSGPNSEDDKILYTEQTETTWWYHFPRKNKPTYHYAFMFNKAGRVIQIQEYGFSEGGKIKAGDRMLGLGASLGDVIGAYGWSYDGEKSDASNNNSDPNAASASDKLLLRYGKTNRIAFQIVGNKVRSITLARIR